MSVVALNMKNAQKAVLHVFHAAAVGAMVKFARQVLTARQTACRFACLLPRITAAVEECVRQGYARLTADVVRLDYPNDAVVYVVRKMMSV